VIWAFNPGISVVDGVVPLRATCPAGTILTGGGYDTNFVSISASKPDGNSWLVEGSTAGAFGPSFSSYAVCLPS
jgi:hypothetical protein